MPVIGLSKSEGRVVVVTHNIEIDKNDYQHILYPRHRELTQVERLELNNISSNRSDSSSNRAELPAAHVFVAEGAGWLWLETCLSITC